MDNDEMNTTEDSIPQIKLLPPDIDLIERVNDAIYLRIQCLEEYLRDSSLETLSNGSGKIVYDQIRFLKAMMGTLAMVLPDEVLFSNEKGEKC